MHLTKPGMGGKRNTEYFLGWNFPSEGPKNRVFFCPTFLSVENSCDFVLCDD